MTTYREVQWEDIFGRDVSASDLIALAEREETPLAQMLRDYSTDIWGDDHDDDVNWDALAAQVERARDMGN
jgi:hypothetical protein